MPKTPVYTIKDFGPRHEEAPFYANYLSPHVREHRFTNLPHKHDFYLVMLVTKGSGWHEIDFKKYKIKKGQVFVMQPGQMHYWELSKDIDGFVFFHSKEFYETNFLSVNIKSYPFFKSLYNEPVVILPINSIQPVKEYMREIVREHQSLQPYQSQRINALINLVYISLSRNYKTHSLQKKDRYLDTLRKFEELIEQNFKEEKLPGFYAGRLNITEKHLNRIVRECVNKTSSGLIADRVILEAKRILIRKGINVSGTGYYLGFNDNSYFIRFFKKHTGLTPLNFIQSYKQK